MKTYKLDAEEQAIQDAIERDEYVSLRETDPEAFEKQKRAMQQAAADTLTRLTRKKSYTMKLIEHDVEQIKIMALERGLPYQTFIASVLHQVATRQVRV
jgi:predicted DNA binding CopG/RHH family protein